MPQIHPEMIIRGQYVDCVRCTKDSFGYRLCTGCALTEGFEYEGLRKLGMCPQCTKPGIPPLGLCETCTKNHQSSEKTAIARKVIRKVKAETAPWAEVPLCTCCYKIKPRKDRRTCDICLLKSRVQKFSPEQRALALAAIDSFDGRCHCCGGTEHGGMNWCFDHCHESGRYRGIVCHGCNVMLGGAKDNPAALLAGLEYLHRASSIKTVAA